MSFFTREPNIFQMSLAKKKTSLANRAQTPYMAVLPEGYLRQQNYIKDNTFGRRRSNDLQK